MKYDEYSEKLNDIWANGFAQDEYGSCQEEGFSAALIISDDLVSFGEWPDHSRDIRQLIGIIEEDDQGFVDYELFNSEQAARDKWARLLNSWERLYHLTNRGRYPNPDPRD